VTLNPIVFTKRDRCSEVKVKMFVGPLYKERQASASGNHVFEIDDVLDYPIPAKKPAIEIGKLIDDISVRAILLTDVSDSLTTSDAPLDGEAARRGSISSAHKAHGLRSCLTASENWRPLKRCPALPYNARASLV
jgi:hypothetical protein